MSLKITEAQIQIQVMTWARVQKKQYPALERLFHIPNGGSRHALEALNLKAQGVKSGVPDLCLPCPVGKYHGLWLEMKSESGRLSAAQAGWLNYLADVGYATAVCFSFDEAVSTIKNYLNGIVV